MINNVLNKQTIADICNAVRDDTRDTIGKIASKFVDYFETLNPDRTIGIVVEGIEDSISSLDNTQIVTGDGDVITLLKDTTNSFGSRFNEDGDEQFHEIFHYVSDPDDENYGKYIFSSDNLTSENGTIWTFEEVLSSITDTYTQNDILNRACELIATGEYTVEAFNGRCSDITQNLTGRNKELYSMIVNCVTTTNTSGIVDIITAQYKGITDATVSDNTIDFEKSNYYVEGFCGTVFLNIIGTVAQVAGQLVFAVNKLAGIVMAIVGTIVNAIDSIAGRLIGYNATINYSSLYRLFAVPICQRTYSKQTVMQQYPWIADNIEEQGIMKVIGPMFSLYIWDNGDDTISFEGFLNCSVIRTVGMSNRHYFSQWVHSGTDWTPAVNSDGLSKDNNPNFNVIDQGTVVSNYGLFPDDNEVRYRVSMALYYLSALVACYNYDRGHYDDMLNGQTQILQTMPNFYEPVYQDPTGSAATAAENALTVLWWYDNRDTLITWESIVNKICPSFADNTLTLDAILEYISYCQAKDNGFTYITRSVSDKGDFWITPPSYTKTAVVGAAIAGAVVAAAAVAGYYLIKTKVRKGLANGMAERYADVTNKYNEFSNDPTNTEKFDSYYKSLKYYNFCAKLTGYSSLSVINGWETGDTSSVVESLPIQQKDTKQISQIVKLIKGS